MTAIAQSLPSRTELFLNLGSATKKVSAHLYGLFIEDINHACDGGLGANLVNNHSFEGLYVEHGSKPFAAANLAEDRSEQAIAEMLVLTPAGGLVDRARHWLVSGGRLEVSENPVAVGAHFARVTSLGGAVIENKGYPGSGRSMGLHGPMRFTARVNADLFDGDLEVRLISADGTVLEKGTIDVGGSGWRSISTDLLPNKATRGALQLVLHGSGALDLDEVTLTPIDHWGAGDPRWSQGVLRRDLVEAMRDLAPRFIRFPGGCLVEGCGDGSHYKWKNTIGPIEKRRPEYNMWGQFVADGDYSQSNQIGFYEYFLLCEDLGAEPMPVVWAGVSCQVRTDSCLPLDSYEFAAVVQDAVDLIDWATGDPASNEWATLRAQAGHPEPFPLNLFGIGNENYGPDYRARFERIRAAVEARRPGMTIIMSTLSPDAPDTADTWAHARDIGGKIVVDEHFYDSGKWMLSATERYDTYPRGTARVCIGEWSAFPPNVIATDGSRIATVALGEGSGDPDQEPNKWASAIAEAAFLTGVERNSDVVSYASFAPLLNLVGNGQWAHNLINFSPTEVAPTVNYYVQQIFATNLGELIVPIDAEFPNLVFASATVDEERVYLKVVNASTAPAEVVVRFNATPEGPATGTLLHAQLTAANRLAFDGVPMPELQPQPFAADLIEGALALSLEPASVIAVRIALQEQWLSLRQSNRPQPTAD